MTYSMPKGSLISFMSNKVKMHGGINLAQGIPGFQPPGELMDCIQHVSHLPIHQYAPGVGNLKLRELILDKYSEYGFTDNNLLVTQGATEALSLIFQYLKNSLLSNFGTMALDPVYESYKHLPRIHNVPFFPFKESLDESTVLEQFIQNNNIRILFINSPGNPFGKTLTKSQLTQMVEVCERNKVYMIIDAVYRELFFEEPPYYPVNKENKFVFYVNSFSKSLSITGWRIGYFFAHEDHMTALRDIHDYIGLCVNSPLQDALAKYLEDNNYGKAYISNIRLQMKNAYNLYAEKLSEFGFRVPQADGGYYIWTELPKGLDGFQFAMEMYESVKVAVIPGVHFSDTGKNYIRVNIAREKFELDEGLKQIGLFLRNKELN